MCIYIYIIHYQIVDELYDINFLKSYTKTQDHPIILTGNSYGTLCWLGSQKDSDLMGQIINDEMVSSKLCWITRRYINR